METNEIIAYYLQCKSGLRTANHFRTTRKRVVRILKEAGVYEERTIHLSEEKENEIISRWQAGQSQLKIGRELSLSQTWIGRFLRKKGIITEPVRPAGDKHSCWRGGRSVDNNGYVRVLTPATHKFAVMRLCDGYILEHRLVMAEHLGRPLESTETVHHINGDRNDNKLENLQLRRGNHGKGMCYRCADCGSRNVIEEGL